MPPAYWLVVLDKLDRFIRKLYRYMQYLEGQTNERKRDRSYFYRQNKSYFDDDIKRRENMRRLC